MSGTHEPEFWLEESDHEKGMRKLISEVLEDRYFSDDTSRVLDELNNFHEAHTWMHDRMEIVEKAFTLSQIGLVQLTEEESSTIRNEVIGLTILHLAVEHFELMITDHFRKISNGEVSKVKE